jgi:hypothetical protein
MQRIIPAIARVQVGIRFTISQTERRLSANESSYSANSAATGLLQPSGLALPARHQNTPATPALTTVSFPPACATPPVMAKDLAPFSRWVMPRLNAACPR